jgi:Leucine-rich repeat (LRR) protein
VLKAGYNQLESLPDCIGELTLLKEMRVGYNQLHQLPASITDLSNLRRLHIGYNPLHGLPENFAAQMSSLKHLGCNETNISSSDLAALSRALPYTKVKF